MTTPSSPGITVIFTGGAPDPVQVAQISNAIKNYNGTDPIRSIGVLWAHGSNMVEIPYTASGDALKADRLARAIVASALFDARFTVRDVVINP